VLRVALQGEKLQNRPLSNLNNRRFCAARNAPVKNKARFSRLLRHPAWKREWDNSGRMGWKIKKIDEASKKGKKGKVKG